MFKIVLNNIGVHDNVSLELPSTGLVLIKGRSGVGK